MANLGLGLMVTCFGVKEKEVLGVPFKDMKKDHAALYARIRRCLQKLVEDFIVNQGKDEQAIVYWWNSSLTIDKSKH